MYFSYFLLEKVDLHCYVSLQEDIYAYVQQKMYQCWNSQAKKPATFYLKFEQLSSLSVDTTKGAINKSAATELQHSHEKC